MNKNIVIQIQVFDDTGEQLYSTSEDGIDSAVHWLGKIERKIIKDASASYLDDNDF